MTIQVPEEIIRKALGGVNDSLAILTPLADFVAKISNEETPQLLSISRIDSRGNWSVIQSQFANKVDAAGSKWRLGGAIAGHHGLVRLHLKAWGCPPHL